VGRRGEGRVGADVRRVGNFRGMPLFVEPGVVSFDGLDLLKMEPSGPDSPGEQGPILDGYIATEACAEMMRNRGLIEQPVEAKP